jgi:hypothetical protein
MALEAYVVQVVEWDLETDGPQPSEFELRKMQRPFTVMATSPEDALDKVTSRTGWCIKEARFLYR